MGAVQGLRDTRERVPGLPRRGHSVGAPRRLPARTSVLTDRYCRLQTLAYYLACQRSYDPDMPRNLAKSVTVK